MPGIPNPRASFGVEPSTLHRVEVWFSETVISDTAQSPSNYRLTTSNGNPVPITSARFDPQNGDRVTLFTTLQPYTSYVLQRREAFGMTRARPAAAWRMRWMRAIPPNRHPFTITDRLTVTIWREWLRRLHDPGS
jgi:hypothetical protein